nr:hypothetical protein [Enterococcus faecium]
MGNPSLNHRYRKGFYSLFKTLQQNHAPTMLFEDLVKIAGYELHYQENLETYENEYWLTELEN